MIPIQKLYYIFLLTVSFSTLGCGQSIEKEYDKMLNEQFPASGTGATALVAVNGEIVYKKAFGLANLELGVPNQTDMVFEIGSITKQFTAVAILMLMEEGKLNLEDDITEYVENYPTHNNKITLHHLLTHISGIKSYTSMPEWASLWRKDLSPSELINFFKDEPMDFDPGEQFRYNNSAYIILGYIIEKVSGLAYQDFINEKIFQPLEMKASYFGSKSKVIKNRASGYQKRQDYINSEYISMTQPYSAGSLMSTVEDLFIWNRAIRSNTLISEQSKTLAFTNHKLNNDNFINYGYGWFIRKIDGHTSIQHAGGIFGYIANSIYLPEKDIYVAVLTNCDCNDPSNVSIKMVQIAAKNH